MVLLLMPRFVCVLLLTDEISGGTLKPKNPQYNYTSHGFEVTLNRGCKIDEVADPEGNEAIPRYSYALTPIAALEHVVEETKGVRAHH